MNSLWPVYEFRPIVERSGDLYRYANGKWVEDDGAYDIAFYGECLAYYVSLPYRPNILWSWTTRHWSSYEPLHRGGNAWHYQLRDGETEWGDGWDRDNHLNIYIGKRAIDRCISKYRCANGVGPKFCCDDPYMTRGLVRRVDTKEVVQAPLEPECMYCGLDWLVWKKLKEREEEEAIQERRL